MDYGGALVKSRRWLVERSGEQQAGPIRSSRRPAATLCVRCVREVFTAWAGGAVAVTAAATDLPRAPRRAPSTRSPVTRQAATTTPRDPAARPCGADRGGVAGIAHPHGAGLVASGSVVAAAFVRSMRRSEVCRVRARDGQRSDRSVLATVWLGVYGLFSLYYYCVVQYLVGGRASTGRGFPSVPAQRLRKRPSLSNPDVTSQAKHVRSPDQMFTLDAADGSMCIISACTICVNTHFPSRMC